jgi:hypothetical protein
MQITAKLTCTNVSLFNETTKSVKLEAKYDPQNSPEDNSFSLYTPYGELNMSITNPAILDQFQEGVIFDVVLTPRTK